MSTSTSSNNSKFIPAEDSPEAIVDVFDYLLAASAAHEDGLDDTSLTAYASSLIARLRHFNRQANLNITAQRQRTSEARNVMDQTHLGLQNLLYERRHLEREIEKCRQFEFIYQDIPLYSEEEFTRLAPESYIVQDEHEFMKNRLEFELVERGRLEEKKKALMQEREKLLREKKEHRTKLDAQSREEAEFAKKAVSIENILSELTLSSAAPTPAPVA